MHGVNVLKKLFGSLVWRIPTNDPVLFLTFDDGPIPEITPWVLELLKQYQAKATFFCIGDNVRKHPDIYKQVIEQGHVIGNHTFHHLNGWTTGNKKYFDDIDKCASLLKKQASASNNVSDLFRPPYGKIRPTQLARLKKQYRIIMWDVLSKDYDTSLSGEQCIQRVVKQAKPGSIIVFHDSLKAAPRLKIALPKVLSYFNEKGYRFLDLPVS
jgi:peptidoglycan/xylan/chitin deacetylase (PgdA/CDA1 family)